MADFGFITISRKLFADPELWNNGEQYDKRSAWVWLLQLAQWRPFDYRTKSGVVHLERGEFLASLQYLEEVWDWEPKKVRLFLGRCLSKGRLKTQRRTQAGTVYLICNYDAYQLGGVDHGTPQGTPDDRPDDERHGQGHSEGHDLGHSQGHIKGHSATPGESGSEDTAQGIPGGAGDGTGMGPEEGTRIRSKDPKTLLSLSERGVKRLRREYPPEFEQLWSVVPSRGDHTNSKSEAYRQWLARIKDGFSADYLHRMVKHYAAVEKRNIETEKIMMAKRLLGEALPHMEAFDRAEKEQERKAAPAKPDPELQASLDKWLKAS